MKKNYFLLKIFVIYLFLNSVGIGKESDYFAKGMEHFKKKEFNKSKIFFERDLAFNPKSEKSYLYLAKIFSKKKNNVQQEINLNNVLLLNPKNDEAIYMLTLIKIGQSNYNQAKELIAKFVLVCESFCSKTNEIHETMETLTPEDAKHNN